MSIQNIQRHIDQQGEVREFIKDFIRNLTSVGTENVTRHRIEARRSLLEDQWHKYSTNHDAISLCVSKLNVREKEQAMKRSYFTRRHFQSTREIYLEALERVQALAASNTTSRRETSATLTSMSEHTQTLHHVPRLPPLDFPKFNGTVSGWLPFKDMFVHMVASNPAVSPIYKIHYLKNCLVGSAAHFLNNTALTENSFQKAWDSLQAFYENKRVLLNNAMHSATTMKKMTRESATELEQLYTSVTQVRQTLETLQRSMAGIDDFLVFLTSQRFDPETIKAWEHHLGSTKTPPTWKKLSDFIFSRLLTLKSYENSTHAKPTTAISSSSGARAHYSGQESGDQSTRSSAACVLCSENHYVARCPQYLNQTTQQRYELISKRKLCYNCLGSHQAKACNSTRRCTKCGSKHHTTIHRNQAKTTADNDLANPNVRALPSGALVNHVTAYQPSCVLLATAKLLITSDSGEETYARALMDQGSEISLISERIVQQLHLRRQSTAIPIVGIGGHASIRTRGVVHLQIQAHFNTAEPMIIVAHILPKLTTSLPSIQPRNNSWSHLHGLQLADPDFCAAGPVDIILGADVYSQIIEEGVVKGDACTPTAQLTKFGWIVSGPSGPDHTRPPIQVFHASVDDALHEALQRFWTLDEIPKAIKSKLSKDEEKCEKHFQATHSRDATGRYIVRLPFKAPASELGESRLRAQGMLCSLNKKFRVNPAFQQAYTDFIKEYETLQHLVQVPSAAPEPDLAYYLPHHGVLKESSLTTKLRVVFNGSSPTSSGKSLNDQLHSGAKLQVDLIDVLLFFRLNRYVFSADMEKFYWQIKVHCDDWKFQRILWYADAQPVTYELTTVTYGLACAAFLSLRAFQQLILDEGIKYPLALPARQNGRYVDDIVGGADTIQEAQLQIDQITKLCMAGGFPIQKWNSNHSQVLSEVPENRRLETLSKSLNESSTTHALGLAWHPTADAFHFTVELALESPITKRKVLSALARIFDPLGLLAPVTIVAKTFVQELWATNLKWDDELSHELAKRWTDYVRHLKHLDQLSIPRWLNLLKSAESEVHGFCDASQKAMSAAVYVRVRNRASTTSTLICAKTKVAPLKRHTIPRLELCAAVLLAKLLKHVISAMDWEHLPVYCWTDSSITHTWVTNHPSRWKEFVHNRVNLIQELLPSAQWRFVPGKMNPADCASRGLTPTELIEHTLWWNGPTWLVLSPETWPNEVQADFTFEKLEERPATVNAVFKAPETPLLKMFNNCSKLTKLLRSTATYERSVLRFKKTPGSSLLQTPLTPGDLEEARLFWVKFVQSAHFTQEIQVLKSGHQLPKSSSLVRLTPRLDTLGVLRVGGRLQNSSLSSDAKHPAILPRRSHFTTLIIRDAHHRTLHGGTQLTLSYIRNSYWVLGGRAPVRSFIIHCVPCARYRQKRAQQLMAPLPATRVTRSRAFLHSGVDYAGPFTIKTWRGRAAKTYKAYLALFVCFSTSAVHLELVSDYTTDGFIAAYKRFTARRGICATLHSDCGTNFKGAAQEMSKLFTAATEESARLGTLLGHLGTKWQFNPPSAPHFGGKWEAGVKSVKYHLRRVIGERLMTFEEMTTLFTQIEAVLNSRPLCALTDDPDDLEYLTPGHFLIGEALNLVPEPSLEHIKMSRLSRWQLIRQSLDTFWSHWSTSCLQRYQAIYKWNQCSPNIERGDMVLVVDERYPPAKWPLGRVLATHPSSDGLTRIVTVRTKTSTLKRPIAKVCLLPIHEEPL